MTRRVNGQGSEPGKGVVQAKGPMSTLPEILTSDVKKPKVVDDCVALIDAEVKDKGGISGAVIKAAYRAVQGVKPGFVKAVVSDLLPDFAQALDPIYQDAKNQGKPVGDFFAADSPRVAEALLAITDQKAQKSRNGIVKGTYEKLRGSAKKNVEAAVPRLGKMVEQHTS
jgi:hypothetical protein